MTVLAAGLAFSPAANASLVLLNAQDFQGTGLGAANTILTIQSRGNSTTETGSVGRLTSAPLVDKITGDAKTGRFQTLTRTLNELGVTSADSLRVVFNALEPGNAANSIVLSNLVLSIFSQTGALLFNSGAFTPVTFLNTRTGAGNSGFVFGLDAEQAAAAQLAAFGGDPLTTRVGLSATANNATGGFETFFVANGGPGGGGPGGNPIPEPATLALVSLGLFGVISSRRRKQ